jgi:hypothetical protein
MKKYKFITVITTICFIINVFPSINAQVLENSNQLNINLPEDSSSKYEKTITDPYNPFLYEEPQLPFNYNYENVKRLSQLLNAQLDT